MLSCTSTANAQHSCMLRCCCGEQNCIHAV
jgi:hypothetical protein